MDDNRFEGPKNEEGPPTSRLDSDSKSSGGAGKKAVVGTLGVLGIGFLKFKGLMLAAMGSLKFGAFFAKFWSMFVMLGVYTMMWGWKYAFIIVMLLVFHEAGHYIWMKHHGLEPKLPVFIPFFGAATAMSKLPDSQAINAWISLAGPIFGGFTSVALFYFGSMYHFEYMIAAGWTGCILNLFQLIPCRPFDGGYAIGAISKWLMLPGCLLIFYLAALWHVAILFIIALVAAFSVFMQFTGRDKSDDSMRPASLSDKFWISFAYFFVLLSLGYVAFTADGRLAHLLR